MWKAVSNNLIHVGSLPLSVVKNFPGQYNTTTISGEPVQYFEDNFDCRKYLRNAGTQCPSYAYSYSYPGQFKPMVHQIATVAFLLDNDRAYVANGLGTGKTMSALWAADRLMELGQVRRVLVVAPISAMWNAWVPALSESLPNRRFCLLKGTAKKKQDNSQDLTYSYIIANPESLHLIADYLPMVDLVIADEATKFKTWSARRTQALNRIAKERRVWMMSATPAPQEPTDAYAQIRIMRGGKYMSFTAFRDMTMLKIGLYKWVPRPGAIDIIAKELQPCIRFSRDDCLDLPELTVIDHKVPMTAEQEKAVKALRDKAVAEIDGTKITAVNAGVVVSKILQVQTGAVYGEQNEEGDKEIIKLNAASVLESIEDLVSSTQHGVIVYTMFRSTVSAIVDYLSNKGYSVAGITADVTGKKRQELFDAMQSGELKVLVAVASTISHGVTLTAADTIIWATPAVSFETYDQANGRFYRKGQTKKCVIYRLFYDGFSKSLLTRLDKKITLQECLLDLLQRKIVDKDEKLA